MTRKRLFLLPFMIAAAIPALNGQTNLPRFDVATIKPIDPKAMQYGGINIYPGGRIVYGNVSLKQLVCTAFNLSYWQLSGGEDWTGTAAYNVEANPPEDMRSGITNLRHNLFTIEDETLRRMLQALLIDRFQLKFHRETKTGTVYLLERNAKAPLLLHPTENQPAEGNPATKATGSIGWAEKWVLANTTMPQLADFAGDYYIHNLVLDRTELTGSFDYRSPPEDVTTHRSDPDGSFLNLIRDIGLKLEATKSPVEVFVIDHADKPSPN